MICIKIKLAGAENVLFSFKISVVSDGPPALVARESLGHFLMGCLLDFVIT
jgi:hypothetical protein